VTGSWGSSAIPAGPGDILAVWTDNSMPARLIRLGARLAGNASPANHVVGITHMDPKGRWIGLQGGPGGVGMVDCTRYLADPRTRSNHGQPRDDSRGQLQVLLASAAHTIGFGYDWFGIAEDAALDLRAVSLAADIARLYAWPSPGGQMPGDVVCSSLWAMLYDLPQVGYRHPDLGDERACQPGNWWVWNDQRQWLTAA
jgi:hypothetical protein